MLAEIAVLASTTIALLSVFGVNRILIIAIAVPLVLLSGSLVILGRRLYSVTTTNVTIAIGGAPGAGKTVYINVLCGQLMEGRSSTLSFAPETQTAQRAYRTIGNLRNGVWPRSTGSDRIDYYKGTVDFVRKSLISVLLNGRQQFRVEFGDSAGQNWDRLADEADERDELRLTDSASVPRLIESSFFTYVGDSDSLFYLIDASLFVRSPSKVAETVDDLISTVTLLRTIEARGLGAPLGRPIAIILSKIDTLHPSARSTLEELFTNDASFPAKAEHRQIPQLSADEQRNFLSNIRQIARMNDVLGRIAENYETFLVSSIEEASSTFSSLNSEEETYSNYDSLPAKDATERPLEWAFWVLQKRQGFRAATKRTTG